MKNNKQYSDKFKELIINGVEKQPLDIDIINGCRVHKKLGIAIPAKVQNLTPKLTCITCPIF